MGKSDFNPPMPMRTCRATGPARLQDQALLAAAAPLLSRGEGGTSGVLKDLTHTFVGLGRALNVLFGANLVLDLSGLWRLCEDRAYLNHDSETYLLLGDGSLRGLVEFLNSLLVVSEILLTSNKDDGKTLAEVQDFGDPLSK
jgi:hypothetical protein